MSRHSSAVLRNSRAFGDAMTQLTLITVGSLKEDYLKTALDEYKKRLGAFCRVEEIELKEVRIANEEDTGEIERALAEEGERILAKIPKGSYTIALCVEGKEYDSPSLAALLGRAADATGKITLIIGSSHGLAPAVKAAAKERLSVSRLTFPHQLMRVILAEALYRSFSILAGKKYHK